MSEANQRQFDWGPPANAGDGVKEWLIYFFIIILLGVGVWVLLDINGAGAELPATAAKVAPAVSSSMNVNLSAGKAGVSQPMTAKVQVTAPPKFFVQLGAFADEASAKEVFDQLTTDGFAPTLAPPDDQYEIHRVLVGPFNTEREAEEKAEALNALGLHCFVSEGP
jgi:cell division septation protein DedD